MDAPKNIVTPLDAYATKTTSTTNNTPQASPPVRRRDAQTGGLLFLGVCHAL
jgi:hypothetical protein